MISYRNLSPPHPSCFCRQWINLKLNRFIIDLLSRQHLLANFSTSIPERKRDTISSIRDNDRVHLDYFARSLVTEIDNLTEPKAANVFEAVRVQDEGIRYQRLVYRSNDSGVGRISDHTLPFGRVGDILTNNPMKSLMILWMK